MGDFDGTNYKDTFIAELVTFVAGDGFQRMFETFFIEHALQFSSAEEHELIYYEIYLKFHKMFEGRLEDFCNQTKVTESEFMIQCRAAREKDEKAKHYIDILLSSVEYETFVKLMKIMRPVAESRLSSKADSKKKDEEGNGSGAKRSSELQRPGGQAKSSSTSSSKAEGEEVAVEDGDGEEEEDPFAADKSGQRERERERDSAEGKGSQANNFARDAPADSPISDAKIDRYNNCMAGSKDSGGNK